MIAYKLIRKMKDGSLSPLFINKKAEYQSEYGWKLNLTQQMGLPLEKVGTAH